MSFRESRKTFFEKTRESPLKKPVIFALAILFNLLFMAFTFFQPHFLFGEEKKESSEPTLEDLEKIGITKNEGLEIQSVKLIRDVCSPNIFDPVIELSVLNKSEVVMTHVFFDLFLKTQNGKVAVFKDSFDYFITGGLDPGQPANWRLFPQPFSKWGVNRVPLDAQFEVQTKKILCKKKNSPSFKEFNSNY